VTISTGSEIGELRQAPAGLPDPAIAPPVVAESGDPFAAVRVVDLVARLERGRPVRLAAVVDRLNATYLDWLFSERVVADAIVQLSMNWAADYRSTGGILLDEGPYGSTVTVEDSTRVDPWIVRQAERLAAACREALVDFSRRERATGHD
jgi:sigma54-dependent transcription regulator